MLTLYILMACGYRARNVESAIKLADASATFEFKVAARTVSIKSATGEAGLPRALSSAGYPAQKVA